MSLYAAIIWQLRSGPTHGTLKDSPGIYLGCW